MTTKADTAGTRERILDTAEELFADHGYAGTRLHEIARRVGIQKASLFHYFTSKEDLYRTVLTEGYHETEKMIRSALEQQGEVIVNLRDLAEAYVDLVVAHPKRTKILLRQSLGDAPPGPWLSEAHRLVSIAVSYVASRQGSSGLSEVDARVFVMMIVGSMAFFLAAAPAIAPDWFVDPLDPATVARMKRYAIQTVDNFLSETSRPQGGSSVRAAG